MATISRLTPAEAHLLQGRLEAEQVPSSIQEEHNAGLPVAGGSLAGVRLEVPDEHAGRAAEILGERPEFEAEAEIPEPDSVRTRVVEIGLIAEFVLYVLFAVVFLYRAFAS